jgi:signal peptidase I
MNYRWFISRKVRHATHMWKHVRNMLNAQRDILSPQAIEKIAAGVEELKTAARAPIPKAELEQQMTKLEEVANKWLKPYPHANYRENIEVFLVALAVAMGIRTFFVQPFKIPTGSMQPALYGVTSTPDHTTCYHYSRAEDRARCRAMVQQELSRRAPVKVPTGLARVRDWFAGISYLDVKAKADGTLDRVNAPVGIRIFNFYQTLVVGGKTHLILFPPDYGQSDLVKRMGLELGQVFRKGDTVVQMKIQAGDHLFVDRLTYNFRKPQRGEIAVFQTGGIQHPSMPQDQFYIKRLVGLGGDRIQIGNDRHLIINGQRLDATTPRFRGVYSFDPATPPEDSVFSGTVNDFVGAQVGRPGLAPLFPDESRVVQLPPDQLMVMGDNTLNSFDSRTWGSFPATNVIGKEFFVYWPITKRFGWGER